MYQTIQTHISWIFKSHLLYVLSMFAWVSDCETVYSQDKCLWSSYFPLPGTTITNLCGCGTSICGSSSSNAAVAPTAVLAQVAFLLAQPLILRIYLSTWWTMTVLKLKSCLHYIGFRHVCKLFWPDWTNDTIWCVFI